jgi:hypothetical protein
MRLRKPNQWAPKQDDFPVTPDPDQNMACLLPYWRRRSTPHHDARTGFIQ